MTTIIVKGANFAGGKIVHYEPPIADLTVCSWVGGDDATFLKNFGSLGPSTVVGNPVQQAEGLFRRFGPNDYLTLPTYRKPVTAIFAVFRDVSLPTGAQTFGFIATSEREGVPAYNGGRRGLSFSRGYSVGGSLYQLTMAAHGDNAGADLAVTSVASANQNVAQTQAGFGELSASGTGGVRAKVYRWTDPASSGSTVDSTNATTLDLSDEATYPLLMGKSYRGSYTQQIDVAFIAIGERLWTATEKQALYDSVKRRCTALGVTI